MQYSKRHDMMSMNKIEGLHFKVRLSHRVRLRIWGAIVLFKVGAWLMQANIDILEDVDGESSA